MSARIQAIEIPAHAGAARGAVVEVAARWSPATRSAAGLDESGIRRLAQHQVSSRRGVVVAVPCGRHRFDVVRFLDPSEVDALRAGGHEHGPHYSGLDARGVEPKSTIGRGP